MIDSRALLMFVTLADEAHFGRSAEALGIAQSVLSLTIKRLEDRLGAPLFERGARRAVRLTRAGSIFLPGARAALSALVEAEQLGRLGARGEAGVLTVGYVFSAAIAGVLPIVIGAFRAALPAVDVRPRLMETPEQLQALSSGQVDVVLLRPRPSYPLYVTVRIVHREDMVLALPVGHALARKDVLKAADLRGETFVLPQFHERIGIIETLRGLAETGQFVLGQWRETGDFVATLALVAGNCGVALVPRSLMSVGLNGVVHREIGDHRGQVSIALGYRPDLLPEKLAAILDAVPVVDATHPQDQAAPRATAAASIASLIKPDKRSSRYEA